MTTSTAAFDFLVHKAPGTLDPETAPWVKWGQGTPDGDAEPWLSAQKGSLWVTVDQTDDTPAAYMKVDEGGDDNDWVLVPQKNYLISKEFNIDNGAGTTDDDVYVLDRAIVITGAYVYYTEATDTAGAASANVKIGTAVAGAQIVAQTALQVSKAIGSKTALTLAAGAGAVAANGIIAIRHTGIATTEVGKYKVVITYH